MYVWCIRHGLGEDHSPVSPPTYMHRAREPGLHPPKHSFPCMAGIPLDKAELIALFLETFLYGIFFTLFWITLWILLKNRTEKKPNHFLITALVFMLILSTAHIAIDFVRIIEAFIAYQHQGVGGPIVYYSQVAHPLHVTKNVLYATLSLTGDMVMVWRCYVVYFRSYLVVIAPAFLLVANAFCGYAACWSVSRSSPGSTIFATSTARWITSFFVLTLCTNTYCTAFIVYRIWTSTRSLGPSHKGSHGVMPMVMAIIESGGIYASALLALLATYLSGSNGQYVALDAVTPIIGIVFTLIIIQISIHTSRTTGSSIVAAASRYSAQGSTRVSPNSYATHSIDIAIATLSSHRALHTDSPAFNESDTIKDTHLPAGVEEVLS